MLLNEPWINLSGINFEAYESSTEQIRKHNM